MIVLEKAVGWASPCLVLTHAAAPIRVWHRPGRIPLFNPCFLFSSTPLSAVVDSLPSQGPPALHPFCCCWSTLRGTWPQRVYARWTFVPPGSLLRVVTLMNLLEPERRRGLLLRAVSLRHVMLGTGLVGTLPAQQTCD